MRAPLIAAVAALGLSGCGTLGADSGTATQVLQNLEHCERTYIGAVGGLTPGQLSVTITCHAKPFDGQGGSFGGAGASAETKTQ